MFFQNVFILLLDFLRINGKAYIIRVDNSVSLWHEFGGYLCEHSDIPLDIELESVEHIRLIFLVEEEFQVFDEDLKGLPVGIGNLLLDVKKELRVG
jgi:hypothetical protein